MHSLPQDIREQGFGVLLIGIPHCISRPSTTPIHDKWPHVYYGVPDDGACPVRVVEIRPISTNVPDMQPSRATISSSSRMAWHLHRSSLPSIGNGRQTEHWVLRRSTDGEGPSPTSIRGRLYHLASPAIETDEYDNIYLFASNADPELDQNGATKNKVLTWYKFSPKDHYASHRR